MVRWAHGFKEEGTSLTSTIVLNAFDESLSVGLTKFPAALLTTTSGKPNSEQQVSKAADTADPSLMSHWMGRTLLPVAEDNSLAVASKTGKRLKKITTNLIKSLQLPLCPCFACVFLSCTYHIIYKFYIQYRYICCACTRQTTSYTTFYSTN